MNEYTVCEYDHEWGVYARSSRCFILFGSKEEMEKRARELNRLYHRDNHAIG